MQTFDDDLALAHRLADAARVTSLSYFGGPLRQWSKNDGSLVTEADIAVEDELRAFLAAERTDDTMLGEERGQTGTGGRRWIVDGIDGTANFAAGTPDWGTLIALELEGQIVVSVCDEPVHKRRYWAVRGGGAFRSDDGSGASTQLRTSPRTELRTSRSYLPPAKWMPDERARAIAQAVASATNPESPIDHPALQIATGTYEVAVIFIAGPWNIAAPSLVVEEAGSRTSPANGD